MTLPLVKDVGSIDELSAARFGGDISAIRVPRTLKADFHAVAKRLLTYPFSNENDGNHQFLHEMMQEEFEKPGLLRNYFKYSASERLALKILRQDMDALESHGYRTYIRATMPDAGKKSGRRTFHQDENIYNPGPPSEAVICCYDGATTEFIRHADAIHVGNSLFTPRPGGEIFCLNNGDICKFATGSTGNIKSLIHRAPDADEVRLLLLGLRRTPV